MTPNQAARARALRSREEQRRESDARKKAILDAVESGEISLNLAARRAGLDRTTIQLWKKSRKAGTWGPDKRAATAAPIAAREVRQELKIVSTLPSADMAESPKAWDQLDEQAQAALKDFGKFRADYLGRASAPWAVEAAHTLLDAYHSDEEEYIVLNVAPGAGKSTLVTHDFVVWAICRERAAGGEPTISLGHRTTPKARWYLTRIGSTLTRDLEVLGAFGRFCPDTSRPIWNRDELMVEPLRWGDIREKEPTVSGASYESSILSGRYKLIIWDDLVDKANSSSVEQREKLIQWWDQEAETRLNTGGLIVLSGARYGPEDLFAHCLAQTEIEIDEDDEGPAERPLYIRIRYPAHYETHHTKGKPCTGPWPNGCLLDPDQISAKKVRRYQAKDEGRWRLVWQQEDVDPKGFLADPVWFTGGTDHSGREVPGCFDADRMFGDPAGLNALTCASVLSLDPSPTKFWAVQHWLLPDDERRQILFNARRQVMQAPEILYREPDGEFTGIIEEMWMLGLDAGVPFTWLVIEVNTANRWFTQYPFFQEWCAARGVTVVRHTTGTNKTDPVLGVEMLGPLYRDGEVRLPYQGYAERLYVDQFVREARTWPEGQTDDQVMAHWFVNSNLTTLQIASRVDEDLLYDTETPTWAHQGSAAGAYPAWAR